MNTTLSASDAVAAGGFLGAFAGAMVTIGIIAFIIYIFVIIAQWKIFVKAGEKGWKSLIPIYNFYVMFRLFWETKWFWVYFGACVVTGILQSCVTQGDASATALILSLFTVAIAILAVIILIMLYNRMSKCFGHGMGFTLGLIFFPEVFLLILGFNKDKYNKIEG